MHKLHQESPHSVVITSGTLGPMDTLEQELGIRLKHTLSCRHVIESSQIGALVLTHGP